MFERIGNRNFVLERDNYAITWKIKNEKRGFGYRVSREIHYSEHLDGSQIVYGIREVFYDDNGDISYIGNEPLFLAGSINELKQNLQNMTQSIGEKVIDPNTTKEID